MNTLYPPILTLCILLIPCAAYSSSSYIGKEIPPTPSGCQHLESGVLTGIDKFAYAFLKCQGQYVVLFEKFVARRDKHAYWQVIDELLLSKQESGHTLLSVPLCQSTTAKNNSVFALGDWQELPASYQALNISKAWRFNFAIGKIETVASHSIVCDMDKPD